jgi:tRNA(Leu) C34 or U34 (ribose-2'-O)-methylase TrmL
MTLTFFADGVQNPSNLARIRDAAALFDARCAPSIEGRLIAVENAKGARHIYGRRPLRGDATLAVGNERRGLSRKTLARADETVVIPTLSRTVTTLNVAAAAAVAAWYVVRGSSAQAQTPRPEIRRPALLIISDDHVEVGSSLRSAAAFGFRDLLLDDRGAGWFSGPASVRREALAAARRHKNPLRIYRGTLGSAAAFEEVVVVMPSMEVMPLQRIRLTHGRRQLVIVGASSEDVAKLGADRVRIATLDLARVERAPLRLIASIAMAEIARQTGRRRPTPSQRLPKAPSYDLALDLRQAGEALFVEPSRLLEY